MTQICCNLKVLLPATPLRWRGALWALGLGLSLGQVSPAAWCQTVGALSPAVVGDSGTWDPTRRETVGGYLRSQVQSMLAGDEAAVVGAREAVLAPFGTAGVSEAFVRQYAQAVARELAPAVQAESVQVRVNAMILAGRLPDPSALGPVAAGLQDSDAGVRYLAAVALNGLMARGQVDQDQGDRVMELVDRQLAAEDSGFVAAPMFQAMLDAGAFDVLLSSLNKRVSWHVGRAQAGFSPEADALRGLYARLFVGDGTPEQIKQLSRASVRYLWLAARQLEAGNVSDNASHVEIIRVTQTALNSVRERLQSSEPTPPDVLTAITQERWGDIVTIAVRWADLLQAPPTQLTPQELAVNAAPPAEQGQDGQGAGQADTAAATAG